MKFPAEAPVTPAKKEALRARIERLGIDLAEIEERFIRGSGPGGQKINKTSSGVQLSYPRRSVYVKFTRERSQALNRFLALRELVDAVEQRISPATSAREQERARIRKSKSRRRRRHRRQAVPAGEKAESAPSRTEDADPADA